MNLFATALVTFLLGMLSGCSSTPATTPAQVVPETKISAATWLQVEQEIWGASVSARVDAEAHARRAVRNWADIVWQQTEKEFIPWYVGYWTQQWLSIKLAWYQLSAGEEKTNAAERLAAHLEEQFYSRVLEPVAQEIDPARIADDTAAVYTRLLADQIRLIPDRYRIPLAMLHKKLKEIPAIDISTKPPQSASLYEILEADELVGVPAYVALTGQNRSPGNGIESRPSINKLDAVARQAADNMADKIALRGGGAAAAAIAGGGIGILISAGIAAWGIAEHQKDRPVLEAELREDLRSALSKTVRILLEDRNQGVLAAIHHMSSHVENHVRSAPLVEPAREDDPSKTGRDLDSLF